MGHRNPQGLFFDRENNFILETEHGPMGGDEINILENEIKQRKEFPNYGWPISSAGEHYGLRHGENKKVPEKYPLHKSHKDYGFIEPLKSFVPSPGLSEIVKIGKNKYALGSMKFKTLYIFELNDQREMIDLQELQLKERIRDLKFKNDNLYLFLEDSASIGIINFK
jgi:glucose/arabinose dehydrogenase